MTVALVPVVHTRVVAIGMMLPTAGVADSVITPQGGVLTFASMPPEVRQFVSDWSAGQQAVSLG
jgi:hypothetical protein